MSAKNRKAHETHASEDTELQALRVSLARRVYLATLLFFTEIWNYSLSIISNITPCEQKKKKKNFSKALTSRNALTLHSKQAQNTSFFPVFTNL